MSATVKPHVSFALTVKTALGSQIMLLTLITSIYFQNMLNQEYEELLLTSKWHF